VPGQAQLSLMVGSNIRWQRWSRLKSRLSVDTALSTEAKAASALTGQRGCQGREFLHLCDFGPLPLVQVQGDLPGLDGQGLSTKK
jgi:hypothetical protein